MQPDLHSALAALRDNRPADALRALRAVINDEWEGLAVAIADEAESLIRAGLIADAIRRIECFTDPKWSSPGHCREQYDAAMNRTSP